MSLAFFFHAESGTYALCHAQFHHLFSSCSWLVLGFPSVISQELTQEHPASISLVPSFAPISTALGIAEPGHIKPAAGGPGHAELSSFHSSRGFFFLTNLHSSHIFSS
jgi:hypothetical protein